MPDCHLHTTFTKGEANATHKLPKDSAQAVHCSYYHNQITPSCTWSYGGYEAKAAAAAAAQTKTLIRRTEQKWKT